jgi:hypothetical protein
MKPVHWAIAYAAFISLSGFIICWLLGGANIGQSLGVGLLLGAGYLVLMLLGNFANKKEDEK